MAGCRMNKLYPVELFHKKTTFEWSSSLGVSFFAFEDKENPEDSSGYSTNSNGEKVYNIDTNTKDLTCLFIAQGIGLNAQKYGVQMTYSFTPYSWFSKRIDSDFGNSSLSLSIYYKF